MLKAQALEVPRGTVKPAHPASDPPPAASAGREPPLDPDALASLHELQVPGQPDVAVEVARLFLREAPRCLASLRRAAASRDPAALRWSAHALRGNASFVGAREMQALCGDLEAAAAPSSTAGIDALLERLELAYQRTAAALRGLGLRDTP